MADNKINVGGRLHSIATGNVLAGANEIFDDDKNKKQSEINTETYSLVNDVNERLDGLSPDQQAALSVAAKATNNETKLGYYVCDTEGNVVAKVISNATGYVLSPGGSMKVKMTNANTVNNATLNINSTGAKALYYDGERASANNTWEAGETVEVYYDGTNFYANNVAGSGGDGVFDVSEKYPTSGVEGGNTYTLDGALAVLNANLPASKKKGGMSIKFVQSSDNKYMQYTLVNNEWSVNIKNWWSSDDLKKAINQQIIQFQYTLNDDKIINPSSGSEIDGPGYSSTSYIEITDEITQICIFSINDSVYNCFYNPSKTKISSFSYNKGYNIIDVPVGAKYMRLSNGTTDISSAIIGFYAGNNSYAYLKSLYKRLSASINLTEPRHGFLVTEIGTMNNLGIFPSTIRAHCKEYIKLDKGTEIYLSDYTNAGFSVNIYDKDKVWVAETGWITSYGYIVPDNYDGYYFRFIFKNASDTDIADASVFGELLTFETPDHQKLDGLELKYGKEILNNVAIGSLNSSGEPVSSTIRAAYNIKTKVKAGDKVGLMNLTGYKIQVFMYDTNEQIDTNYPWYPFSWTTDDVLIPFDGFCKVIIGKTDDSTITDSDIISLSENLYLERFEYSDTKVRVCSANVWNFNDDYSMKDDTAVAWRDFFGKYQPDVVGMQEYNAYFDQDESTDTEAYFGNIFNMSTNKTSGYATIMSLCTKGKLYGFYNYAISPNRSMIFGFVEMGGRCVFVGSTHLTPAPSATDVRAQEMSEIIDWMNKYKYVIVTGDFNTEDFSQFTTAGYKIANNGFFGKFLTYNDGGQLQPEQCEAIDNIIVSPNIWIDGVDMPDNVTSDHRPIIADLTFK